MAAERALWLTFRGYGKEPPSKFLFHLRPQAAMEQALRWVRGSYSSGYVEAVRRPGVSEEAVQAALERARAALPFVLRAHKTVEKAERREFSKARRYAARILGSLGEEKDIEPILSRHRDRNESERFLWASVVARMEARLGRLADGRLAALATNGDRYWGTAAALHLHQYGVTAADPVLHQALREPSTLWAGRMLAFALLDSTQPATLDAMRGYMDAVDEARQRKENRKHRNFGRNEMTAPALYLLVHGTEDDLRRVAELEITPWQCEYLAFLAEDPIRLAEPLLGVQQWDAAARLAHAVLDRRPAVARAIYLRVLHRTAGAYQRWQHSQGRDASRVRGNFYHRELNRHHVLMSHIMPSATALRFYARMGRVTPLEPGFQNPKYNSPTLLGRLEWWPEPGYLDKYVTWWLDGKTAFNEQLEYLETTAIEEAVERIGEGRTPPAYELFLAAHRTTTRAYQAPRYRYAVGVDRRAYMLRYQGEPSYGVSGVAEVASRWLDDRARIRLRLRQKDRYHVGALLDLHGGRKKSAHYPYVINGGRKMIDRVVLRRRGGSLEARDTGRVEDGFFVFEADTGTPTAAGWRLDLHMKFVDQEFTLSYDLFAGEGSREQRRALERAREAERRYTTNPADAQAADACARALVQAGRLTEAWGVYRQRLKQTPGDKDLWWTAADAFIDRRFPAKAAVVLAEAAKTHPREADFPREQARQLYLAGSYPAAAQAAAAALELEPEAHAVGYTRGVALLLAGRRAEAAHELAKLPDAFVPHRVLPLRYIAARTAPETDGKTATEALAALHESLKDTPEQAPIGVLLGKIYHGHALRHCKTAADRCRAHTYLAYRYLFKGNEKRAAEHFAEAVKTRQLDQVELRLAQAELERLNAAKPTPEGDAP